MTKFKIGDAVVVLDDDVKGTVKRIDNDRLIIETDDGFDLQFNAHELIPNPDTPIHVSLNDEALLKAKQDLKATNKTSKKRTKKEKNAAPFEVDLHIDKLVSSTKGMTKHEMLNKQLDTARGQLEFAIKKRIPRMVFIHGVGEGVLRMELEYLLGRYPVRFEDANFRKYGVGATEVFIFQNTN